MSLELEVQRNDPKNIWLAISVDGKPTWTIGVLDERPDMSTDPVLVVYDDPDGDSDPAATFRVNREVNA